MDFKDLSNENNLSSHFTSLTPSRLEATSPLSTCREGKSEHCELGVSQKKRMIRNTTFLYSYYLHDKQSQKNLDVKTTTNETRNTDKRAKRTATATEN